MTISGSKILKPAVNNKYPILDSTYYISYIVFVHTPKCKFSEQPRQKQLRKVRFPADWNGSGPSAIHLEAGKDGRRECEEPYSPLPTLDEIAKIPLCDLAIMFERYLHPVSTGRFLNHLLPLV